MESSDVEESFIRKNMSISARRKPLSPTDYGHQSLGSTNALWEASIQLKRARPYSLKGRAYAMTGEVNFMQEDDVRLETTRARLSNVLKRHEDLKERLSRDSDKMIYERLQKEFEAALAAQTEGESRELYHCVLESRSFLEKMTVAEHTIPFFLPAREAENDLLSSNAMKFIDYVGELVEAYVDRREQINLIKELYGHQVGELYHSLPYHVIEFVLNVYDCKVTVSLRYADLVSILPTRVRVLAWPIHPTKKTAICSFNRSANGMPVAQSIPARLSYAEDSLRMMALPEAYAEIVLKLPQYIGGIFQQ